MSIWPESRVWPWNRMPELRHLSPQARREYWQYCKWNTPVPTNWLVIVLKFWLIAIVFAPIGLMMMIQGPTLARILLGLALSLCGLFLQFAVLVHARSSGAKKAVRRELLSQFAGRAMPKAIETMRCPYCDYDLVARPSESVNCPECGSQIGA